MGQIIVGRTRPVVDPDCGDRVVHRESTEREVLDVLRRVETAKLKEGARVCYVYGMGSEPKSTYKKFSHIQGVDVLFAESVLPSSLRVFAPIVASYRGLVKIQDMGNVELVFTKLMQLSMVGLYVFSESVEHTFVSLVKANEYSTDYRFGANADPSYFVYIVNGDASDSRTGVIETAVWGAKFQQNWVLV